MNEVYSIGEGGKRRDLIFNDTVLLISKSDKLVFDISTDIVTFALEFIFTEEGEEFAGDSKVSDDGRVLTLTLHKWEHSSPLENTAPIVFPTNSNSHLLYLKYSSYSHPTLNQRTFNVSLWAEKQNDGSK
jgi:hypothetical protein